MPWDTTRALLWSPSQYRIRAFPQCRFRRRVAIFKLRKKASAASSTSSRQSETQARAHYPPCYPPISRADRPAESIRTPNVAPKPSCNTAFHPLTRSHSISHLARIRRTAHRTTAPRQGHSRHGQISHTAQARRRHLHVEEDQFHPGRAQFKKICRTCDICTQPLIPTLTHLARSS